MENRKLSAYALPLDLLCIRCSIILTIGVTVSLTSNTELISVGRSRFDLISVGNNFSDLGSG